MTKGKQQSDVEWEMLRDWIKEMGSDLIPDDFRQGFEHLVVSCTRAYFYETRHIDNHRMYQLRVLAFMYIVSATLSDYTIELETLQGCCKRCCYTRQEIINAIYDTVGWLGPTGQTGSETELQNIVTRASTRVDLVKFGATRMVRKRITHMDDNLPAYDAMVELVTHYVLKTTGTSTGTSSEYGNIARLLRVHIDDQFTDLYYEYIHTPLSSLFCRDPTMIRLLVRGMLRGVQSLHAVGIAHRDLKAANIHVRSNLQVMLLDLGAAGHGLIRKTIPICTITHRSPEILLAESIGVTNLRYDGKKLDMWSIGVLIVELYTGADPFGHITCKTSPHEVLSLIRLTLGSITSRMQGLLSTLQYTYLCRCLQEDPLDRPTIDVLLLAFEESSSSDQDNHT
jgi:hypothetical protein